MIGSLDILPKGLNLTIDEEDELVKSVVNFLGHRRRNKFTFPLLISLYSFIFATGLTGNLCKLKFNLHKRTIYLVLGTCITIWKSRDMHTPTNFYLFSLAVSDLLLISLGK
jgi:neuromedin U receptor 1